MKRKIMVSSAVLVLVAAIVCCMGLGYYSSSSAVRDLRAELETLYGNEYTGKAVDSGTEDMVFVVEPKTWFLTNWNLRNALNLNYEYECSVIFTNYVDGSVKSVRTITYKASDPMGTESNTERAYLHLDSKAEKTESPAGG